MDMHIMIYNAFYQCSVISPWEKKMFFPFFKDACTEVVTVALFKSMQAV